MDGDNISPSNEARSNDGTSDPQGKTEDKEESDRSLRRRASSLVSFDKKQQEAAAAATSGHETPRLTNVTIGESTTSAAGGDSPGRHSSLPSNTGGSKHNRQQVLEIRKARNALFKSYETADFDNIDGALACSHFASVAIALSSLLGGHKDNADRKTRVTVEDIFFAAQVPLHMLHSGPPNLTVMNDIVREFIDVDNRFKGQYAIETLHFDIAPSIGQVELGNNEVGDRQSKMQLPEFRKGISHDVEEESEVVRIVNYDPFILEQAMLVDETDEGSDPTCKSNFGVGMTNSFNIATGGTKYKQVNDGAYAVVVDFRNAVQPMVTIAEGAVSDSLFGKLTEVPANALFKAMMSAEEAHRARGYIRIFRKRDNAPRSDEVPYFFTPELCSGKVLGTNVDGTHAQVISSIISPHITACAWAMHLICGVRPNTHGHGKGLPVTDIIHTLHFPSDIFLNCDMSLDQVYLYFQQYLREKLLDRNITLGLYPVLTKINREDAVPTISVFDLESILIDVKNGNEDPEAPQHVMIIQYNANVAHNVINIAHAAQWCVLVGYDDDSQVARLIDANPKKFSQSWTIPLDRLHKAMTGYGYIMVSRPKELSGSQQTSRSSTPSTTNLQFGVGALRHVASTVQRRLDLVREQQHNLHFDGSALPQSLKTFMFPSKPFTLTVLAMAMMKLGHLQTFEDFIHKLPFDVNALILKNFGLECAKICLDLVIKSIGLDDQIAVSVRHFEKHSTGKLTVPIKQFTELLNKYVVGSVNKENNVLIANFDGSQLNVFGQSNPFGNTGIIVDFDENESMVTVVDANVSVYHRTWTVPLESLHKAMQNLSSGYRNNGLVVVSKVEKLSLKIPEHYRIYDLSLLPVQNIFHVSPSPQVQGLSLAFAQLGHFYSPEEIFYEAYLKTMSDQRRRGSQAFAWRDVDVSLAIVNKKIDAKVMTLVSKKFLESRKVTGVTVELVDDIDVDHIDDLLLDATAPHADHILLLNYNTQAVHGLSNMGSSVALIQSYDPMSQTVGLFDSEYTLFGLRWTCNLSQLIEAGDLDNVGSSPYGFVRIGKRSSVTEKSASGAALKKFAFANTGAFGDEEGREASMDHSHESRKTRATFVNQQ